MLKFSNSRYLCSHLDGHWSSSIYLNMVPLIWLLMGISKNDICSYSCLPSFHLNLLHYLTKSPSLQGALRFQMGPAFSALHYKLHDNTMKWNLFGLLNLVVRCRVICSPLQRLVLVHLTVCWITICLMPASECCSVLAGIPISYFSLYRPEKIF